MSVAEYLWLQALPLTTLPLDMQYVFLFGRGGGAFVVSLTGGTGLRCDGHPYHVIEICAISVGSCGCRKWLE